MRGTAMMMAALALFTTAAKGPVERLLSYPDFPA